MNYSQIMDEDEFKRIKSYLKVDIDFEDELIKEMLDASALMLLEAIDSTVTIVYFLDDPRFHLAVKKQTKEEYEQRGISADTMRHELANGVENIIHQLRLRGAKLDDNKKNE